MTDFCFSVISVGVRYGFVFGITAFLSFFALGCAMRYLYNVIKN